jgi:hypothetical protein
MKVSRFMFVLINVKLKVDNLNKFINIIIKHQYNLNHIFDFLYVYLCKILKY